MKKLMSLLMTLISLTSQAASFLQDATCTGINEVNEKVTVNLHLDDRAYCEGGENFNTAVIVMDSEIDGQEVFTGTYTETVNGNDLIKLARYSVMEAGEGEMSIELSYSMQTAKGTLSFGFKPLGEESLTEVVNLKCETILYNMDC